MLMEAGSDVNAKDEIRYTALMYAAKNGYAECTQMLIKGGSDITANNWRGETAQALATERNNNSCKALLNEAYLYHKWG